MRKLQLLKKTFLVVAGLLVGSSAWAEKGDVIYSNDFSTNNQTDFATWIGTGKVPSGYSNTIIGRSGSFSIETGALVHTAPNGKSNSNVYDADFGTFTEAITKATKSKNYVLSFDITLAITNHIACNSIFEISGEDKKTILCLYADHTRKDKTTGATSYGYIVGGNNAFATKDATISGKTNTEGSIGDGTKHVIAGPINGTTGSKTYHVILDAQTVGMAKLTITEGETTIVNEASVSISAEKGLKWIYLANYNSWETPSSQITIDNLSIVEGAPTEEAVANYKVKYVAEISGVETEIKTEVTRSGIVGNGITLEDADKNDIIYNNVKYIYSTDNASTTTIADDNSTEVKVTFVEAPSYTYSVIDNLGNTLASGSAYKGNDVYFYVPYFVFKDSKFYQSPSLSSGTLSYAQGKITSISANTEITVTYTEEENTNVVFYSEAENLTGVTPYEDGYTNIRMSNGKTGYYGAETAFVTLPAGVYTLTAASRAGTTSFYAGTVGQGTEIGKVSSTGAVTEATSDEFTLYEPTDIYSSVGNSTVYFDYVIIRKTGDAPAPDQPIGYVTDIELTKRKISLACLTSGATIYYNETTNDTEASGWTEYTAEFLTTANTIYAYAAIGTVKSSVLSYSTGAGQSIPLNSPTITRTGTNTYTITAKSTTYAGISIGSVTADPSDQTIHWTINGGEEQIQNGPDAYLENVDGDIVYWTTDNNSKFGESGKVTEPYFVPTVTITDAGWATFYTDLALDFSGLSDKFKTYTATYDCSTVTLSEVSDVPGGTGVVLKGKAGEYKVPVIAAASNTKQGDLMGSTTEDLVYDQNADLDYYMLAWNDQTKKAQFMLLNSGTIAKGKAYLAVPKATQSDGQNRALAVVFEGESVATGIQSVGELKAGNDAIYSLSGQRVSQPSRGLFIVNGKKVIK